MSWQRHATPRSIAELMVRAGALRGFTVACLARALGASLPDHSRNAKGCVGKLVEHALGADPQAYTQPDFPALGVELKTIPVNAAGTPVESTFCCSVAMAQADTACWESSTLRQRLAHVLFVPVLAPKGAPLAARVFGQARLWRPSSVQQTALRQDWEDLMGKIGAGQSGHLGANVGQVLQVRPKAAHARVRTLGHGPSGIEAVHPLAFYLRATFTAALLRDA